MTAQAKFVTTYTQMGLVAVNCPACKSLLFKVNRSAQPLPVPSSNADEVGWAMVAQLPEIQIKCTCRRIIGYSLSGETRIVSH